MDYKRITITMPEDLLDQVKSFLDDNEYGYSDLSPLIHKSLEAYLNFLKGEPTTMAPEVVLLSVIIGKHHYSVLKKYCEKEGKGINDFISEAISLTSLEGKTVLEKYLTKWIREKMQYWEVDFKKKRKE